MAWTPGKRHFWLRKIHSLTGFVPIGLYLVVHIFFENSSIRFFPNGTGFNTVADFFGEKMPLTVLGAIEVVLIGSILYHGIYGLFIVKDSRPNVYWHTEDVNKGRQWNFTLQRVTGVIALLFLGYHVWTTRISVYLGMLSWAPQVKVDAAWMAGNIFGHGWLILGLYVVGVASAIYHFFNGVWNGLISWGITVGPRSQKVSAWICTTVGILSSAFGIWVLWGFKPFLSS